MKILLVNKFHWNKGGSEKYYFDLGQLLKENGHEVAYFSMEDEKNVNTGDKTYFVPKFDLNNSSKLKALDVIYNKENEKVMDKALDDFKPDVVHLNNFQRQLSASIIKPCVKRHIPIVFTAHDVQAICPAITMLDNEGNVCEKCLNGKYMNCVKKSCVKGSKLKSVLGAFENNYYRNHKVYSEKINMIITPSDFLKKMFVKDGIKTENVTVLHNFVDLNDYNVKVENNGYALYFGRLSKEKGIMNLILAFAKTENGLLYIAGDGPEKDNIVKFIEENNLSDRVKLLGFLNKEQMTDAIRKCKFVVVPSICNENCPYSIIEAMVMSKPVIGSAVGGIPELILNGKTGIIYDANNIDDLANALNTLFNNDKLVNEYSNNAKEQAQHYSKDEYYEKLMNIYNEVIKEMK